MIFKQFAVNIQEGMGNNMKFMLHCDNTLYNSHINIAIHFKICCLANFQTKRSGVLKVYLPLVSDKFTKLVQNVKKFAGNLFSSASKACWDTLDIINTFIKVLMLQLNNQNYIVTEWSFFTWYSYIYLYLKKIHKLS